MTRKDLGRDIFSIGLRCLLRPIANFCVRNAVKFQEINQEVKRALLQAAKEDLRRRNESVSISRLSIMTGLQRKDIAVLEDSPSDKTSSADMLSRVLSVWSTQHPFFSKQKRTAKPLTFEGNDSEFAKLVKKVSSDLNHHTVLFELERAGVAVRDTVQKKVTLRSGEYITYDDPAEAYALLSRDLNDMVQTVEKNILTPIDDRLLHATTQFDNVYVNALPLIKSWLKDAGKKLHAEARMMISKYDADNSAVHDKSITKGGAGARIGIGTFGFMQMKPETENCPEVVSKIVVPDKKKKKVRR